MSASREFYDQVFSGREYAHYDSLRDHARAEDLLRFVAKHKLQSCRCLEVGCGRGLFQDLVDDYVGTDITDAVSACLHKPFVRCDATELPFESESFDAVWTIHVFEHVREPELALDEIRRVLKPNGLLFFAPAWHTRPWFAHGYPVRPYRSLDWKGRAIKASLIIRDNRTWRFPLILGRRLWRAWCYSTARRPIGLRFRRLEGNVAQFWMSDSDAVSSLDPFDVMAWFESRGDRVLVSGSRLSRLAFRGHVIEVCVKPSEIFSGSK